MKNKDMPILLKPSLIGTLIGLFIFMFFACLFSSWGFDIDDCGVIYGSWKLLQNGWLELFKCQDNGLLFYPSNYMPLQNGQGIPFFFRPFTLLFFALQYPFFHSNAWAYFAVMVFFHALNAVFVFYILQVLLKSLGWATWGALFFGFHLTLWTWMGWIAAQPYTISLAFLFLSLFLFFAFLQDRKIYKWWLAGLFYAIALLLFEIVIFYPLVLAILWWMQDWLNKQTGVVLGKFWAYLKLLSIFFITTCGYFLLRFSVTMSTVISSEGVLQSINVHFIQGIYHWQARLPDVYSFVVDMCHLCFIPGGEGHRLLKGGLSIIILALFGYMVYRSKHKRIIWGLSLLVLVCMWRIITARYFPRYFYYATVPLTIMITLVFKDYYDYLRGHAWKKRAVVFFLCASGVVIFNCCYISSRMKVRENILYSHDSICRDIIGQIDTKADGVCFIGLPRNGCWTGFAQKLWMLGLSANIPVYYDCATFMEFADSNNQQGKLDVNLTIDGLRLTSLTPESMWILSYRDSSISLGERIVRSYDEKLKRIYSMDIIFNGKYKTKNLVFVVMDYEKNKFKILDNSNTDQSLLNH